MTEHERNSRVMIVPCSGIGKTFGSVSREAACEICGRCNLWPYYCGLCEFLSASEGLR